MPADVLAQVRQRFPQPWVIGWNRYESVVQIEVNLRVERLRWNRRRGTGSTWAEALEDMR